jgi:hypothetical protein
MNFPLNSTRSFWFDGDGNTPQKNGALPKTLENLKKFNPDIIVNSRLEKSWRLRNSGTGNSCGKTSKQLLGTLLHHE